MPRTEVWAGARRKAAPGKAAFRRPSRRSIKVWICRYERAPLTIARIENRITPACPYIFPSARRRSGMAARQVRRSVVIRNLQIRLLAMDSDRTPLGKGKDVLHGAARAAPLRQSVEQPWLRPPPERSLTPRASSLGRSTPPTWPPAPDNATLVIVHPRLRRTSPSSG